MGFKYDTYDFNGGVEMISALISALFGGSSIHVSSSGVVHGGGGGHF